MTASTAEKIIESFLHPTILPIIGQPTYETIAPVHSQLNADSASAHSHRVNGQLSLLNLTFQGEVFNTFSDVEFVLSVNLGQHPVTPEGNIGPAAASILKEYHEKSKEFLIYDQTYKELKSLSIAVVD